jgi:hypothetical protein
MKLSGIFDGEEHWFIPDEDFRTTTRLLAKLEEVDMDDPSPWEADFEPVYTDAPEYLAPITQAWGSFSVAMGAICQILEVGRDQYQHNFHSTNEIGFSFQVKEPIGERL